MKFKRIHVSYAFAFSILAALIVAGTIDSGSRISLENLAFEIVDRCRNEAFRPSCYDREIPNEMDAGLSMEETFELARLVQRLDPDFRYCHVLAHKISAKETEKDPSRWKDIVARAPSGICSNGAIHGAFQERFRTEALPEAEISELKQELEGVCDPRGSWNPTGLEQGSCVHALGHLTMYVTAADIHKSLTLCDEIGRTQNGYDMRQLCYDGAFMQIFQPLEPDDFALIEGKEQTKETAPGFCLEFPSPYRTSCVSESGALFREEIRNDPQALLSHCGILPSGFELDRCKVALIHYIVPQFNLDSEYTILYCAGFFGNDRNLCFSNAAARFLEIDWGNTKEAVDLCIAAERHGAGEACFSELARMSIYNFHAASKEAQSLCAQLPRPWSMRCGHSNSL